MSSITTRLWYFSVTLFSFICHCAWSVAKSVFYQSVLIRDFPETFLDTVQQLKPTDTQLMQNRIALKVRLDTFTVLDAAMRRKRFSSSNWNMHYNIVYD